jgi:alkyldihydroxyacetonephosphate synthase
VTRQEVVTDLWPLGLMRRRAGAEAAAVEVVRPQNVEEVVATLRSGRRVVAMGGASGVCGALAPEAGDLVLDLEAFDAVDIDEANLLVRAGAGVGGLELEQRLNERGLTLGHYPASLPVARIGGLVSTRSIGQESSRYGGIEEMLLGLTVALADGTVAQARLVPRTAVGPPMHQLFSGAEGAFGVVLEAVLRIHRLPEAVIGRGWHMADVGSGLEALREMMQRDMRPLVARLYDPDDTVLQGALDLDGGCLLVVACAGEAPVALAESNVAGQLIEAAGGKPLGEEPWARWRRHRFDLSADRMRDLLEPPGAYVDTIEVAALWSRLPAIYQDVKAHLTRNAGLALCHFSHPTSQGCCAYFTFAGSAADEALAEAVYTESWRGTMEAVLRLGGTIGHHHGVGQVRAPWARAELGGWAVVWDRFREALDSQATLNPRAMGGRVAP